MAQSLTATSISTSIYWARENGYRELQQELKRLRNMGAIVITFALNLAKRDLFDRAGDLIEAYGDVDKQEARKIDVDEDHTIRLTLPARAIIGNRDAIKMKKPQGDDIVDRWLILTRKALSNTIHMIPNGFGYYLCFAGDAVKVTTYFDTPVYTRIVETDLATHYLAATAIHADDILYAQLKAAERGAFMRVEPV